MPWFIEVGNKLRNAKWFQNHWLSGLFLFGMNFGLFGFTGLFLLVIAYLYIPFVHLLIIALAVSGSIVLWLFIRKTWQGTKRNRFLMGAVGSSFYLLMALLFGFKWVTLKPSSADTCMGADVGLFLGIIVATVAFTTCLILTGFSRGKGIH